MESFAFAVQCQEIVDSEEYSPLEVNQVLDSDLCRFNFVQGFKKLMDVSTNMITSRIMQTI